MGIMYGSIIFLLIVAVVVAAVVAAVVLIVRALTKPKQPPYSPGPYGQQGLGAPGPAPYQQQPPLDGP